MSNIPVLFLVFNRPDVTRQSFEAIRQIKPKQLFVAADGPRKDNEKDQVKCRETRDIIMNNIDWDCELKTLFRDENLGCGVAVSSSITWFFKQVDQGVIIEDDIIPNESFFRFTETLLNKYKNSENIGVISGQASLGKSVRSNNNDTYFFSKYPRIWGWATWKRVWDKYDVGIKDIAFEDVARNLTPEEKDYWLPIYQKYHVVQDRYDTWDYQLSMTLLANGLLSVIPNVNLVSNIGFGEDATHTSSANSPFANNPTSEIDQIRHPLAIKANARQDKYYFKNQLFGGKPELKTRLKIFILKALGRM